MTLAMYWEKLQNHTFWKAQITENGPSNMLFFKWLLSKILYWILSVLWKFYHVTNTFGLRIWQRNFSFEICTEMHFVSSCFLNEWKITTFLLMIHLLKCTIEHYSNLNSSSIIKLLLNHGLLNMLSLFFSISYFRSF